MLQTLRNDNVFLFPGRGAHRSTLNLGADFCDTTVRTMIVVRVPGPASNLAQPLRSPADVLWLDSSAHDLVEAVREHESQEDTEDFERWLSDFL